MARGIIWLLGAGLLLLGFVVGRMVGPPAIVFPAVDEARDAVAMENAVRSALVEPRAFSRASTLIRLFEGLTQENVVGASRAVTARAAREDPVDLLLFLTAWVHLDPLAAVREVESWPIQSRREIGIKTAIREWAASGRQLEAADYFQTITDPDLRAAAAGPLVRGWALGGTAREALGLAQRLWNSEAQLDVVDGFVRGVLHSGGPEAAIGIAGTVAAKADGDFEQRLARVTLSLTGLEDPVAAAGLYDELTRMGPTEWLSGSLARLAESWGNDDPQAALEWLLTRADSAERSGALGKTMGRWAIRDFDTAWAWFAIRRGAAQGDAALGATDSTLLAGLLRRMARIRPVEASRWVTRLRDASDRDGLMLRVAFFWSSFDPVSALQWIDGLTLPAEQRDRLRQAVEGGRQQTRAGRELELLEAPSLARPPQ
ncbi:MAG: hypothetical protein V3T64_13365 [Myxococcota bacterium]